MENDNIVLEPGELDDPGEVEFRRAKEEAKKYLKAHGYEILSCELEIPQNVYAPYVKIVAVKDGKKIFYRHLVR